MPGVSRKRWIIAGAAAAAAVVTVAVVVVIVGLSPGPTPPTAHKTATSSSKTSPTAQTTSPAPMPMVAPDRLDSILLSVQDVNTLMGATAMQPEEAIFHGLLIPPGTMSNPDCLGTVFIAEQPVYQGSGYTAMSGQELHEPGNPYAHLVEQAAVSFPSADLALAFVKKSADKWRACGGQTISEMFNGQSDRWIVGDLGGVVPTIVQLHRLEGRGWACQHVLSAVSNLVIEVNACGNQISDQARQIADKMAIKATQ